MTERKWTETLKAAQSILESSDDEDEPSLASLQQPKLPAMPEEQDRKKFLGCLAAIMAAAFDFDTNIKVPEEIGEVDIPINGIQQRRYHLLSQFLMDSSLYLKLEKGQAKAFLPLLSRLVGNDGQEIPHLKPFLEHLTPEAAFRCFTLLLLNHLVHSERGYDARIRRALKLTAIITLRGHPEVATRKFEALEQSIATKLMKLGGPLPKTRSSQQAGTATVWTKDQVLRGIKIGGAAVAAGALFALSGGLAATSLAAGVAALGIGGTTALLSPAALTAILGLGGGSLAAYKMRRRVQGLSEFEFVRQSPEGEAQLYSTICLSGWVTDASDFERPWGVTPKDPPISLDEKLERFYAIHRPDHIMKVERILDNWRGEESELWHIIRQKYGTDPDHLFPLRDGPRHKYKLSVDQQEVVDELFSILGYTKMSKKVADEATPMERVQQEWNSLRRSGTDDSNTMYDSLHGPHAFDDFQDSQGGDSNSYTSSGLETSSTQMAAPNDSHLMSDEKRPPRHILTVWDYHSRYGGELYTVKWETKLLSDLCNSVKDLAFELASGGGARILLSHTALSTLATAFAWPLALVNAANMIDGTWTLAVERADEAGKELARSLLLSQAGNRPVTLIGYSFGARTIYSCLKELAKYQERWEEVLRSKRHVDPLEARPIESIPEDNPAFFLRIREPASIVEDAIMMGLPNHLSISSWKVCRQVVSGRLVNCYSSKDLILSLMFQVKRFGIKPVCGTCDVDVKGVENFDVSDLIKGHQDYCLMIGKILRRIRHCQPFRSDRYSRSSKSYGPPRPKRRVDKYDV